MLVILGVGAKEVCGCKSNLAALWKMVLEHGERNKLLNDGKKWNRKVGAEYFCKKDYVPKSEVVFAWNWYAQEKRGAWGVTTVSDKLRKRKSSASNTAPSCYRRYVPCAQCGINMRSNYALTISVAPLRCAMRLQISATPSKPSDTPYARCH